MSPFQPLFPKLIPPSHPLFPQKKKKGYPNLSHQLDIQNPKLPLLPHRRSLLLPLHPRLDIPPPLRQHPHPLRHPNHLPHHRPLRARLGRRAIQMLSRAGHHILPLSRIAKHQPLLALLHHARRLQRRVCKYCC